LYEAGELFVKELKCG